MLYSILLTMMMQLPVNDIIHEPAKLKVIIQEKVVTQKVYVYVDKFGIEHEGENKLAVKRGVDVVNQKPFQMRDAGGYIWTHPDKNYLENWVSERNRYLMQPAIPQAYISQQNCSRVS